MSVLVYTFLFFNFALVAMQDLCIETEDRVKAPISDFPCIFQQSRVLQSFVPTIENVPLSRMSPELTFEKKKLAWSRFEKAWPLIVQSNVILEAPFWLIVFLEESLKKQKNIGVAFEDCALILNTANYLNIPKKSLYEHSVLKFKKELATAAKPITWERVQKFLECLDLELQSKFLKHVKKVNQKQFHEELASRADKLTEAEYIDFSDRNVSLCLDNKENIYQISTDCTVRLRDLDLGQSVWRKIYHPIMNAPHVLTGFKILQHGRSRPLIAIIGKDGASLENWQSVNNHHWDSLNALSSCDFDWKGNLWGLMTDNTIFCLHSSQVPKSIGTFPFKISADATDWTKNEAYLPFGSQIALAVLDLAQSCVFISGVSLELDNSISITKPNKFKLQLPDKGTLLQFGIHPHRAQIAIVWNDDIKQSFILFDKKTGLPVLSLKIEGNYADHHLYEDLIVINLHKQENDQISIFHGKSGVELWRYKDAISGFAAYEGTIVYKATYFFSEYLTKISLEELNAAAYEFERKDELKKITHSPPS